MSVRIGLIARADDRGLGNLTWEFHKAMKPAKTLVVLTDDPAFPNHPERFTHGDVIAAPLDMKTLVPDEEAVEEFLFDIDVVYTAETFYDWCIATLARDRGITTVVHGMPELCVNERLPPEMRPDHWAWPTSWMLDDPRIPEGTVLPVPVGQSTAGCHPHDDGLLRVMHPAGKRALGNRNGTDLFESAASMTDSSIGVTIHDAEEDLVADRWSMYDGQHVCVIPRRYGGLCLPAMEAMASGVPVIMPDCDPNMEWPGPRVPSRRSIVVRTPVGKVATHISDPIDYATIVDILAEDRGILAEYSAQALMWAKHHSWSAFKSTYDSYFESL